MRNVINSSNRAGEFEKRMLAYTQLNRFLVAFINNVSKYITSIFKSKFFYSRDFRK
jgi:hypothetical protein